jgi:hypothetical protein
VDDEDKDDPFNDPAWKKVEVIAGAPPRPTKGYITCPLTWLARMRPLIRSVDQLLVLMLLYRQCLVLRSNTVALSNSDLEAIGISRQTKYRLLKWLQDAGAASTEVRTGRAVQVTLHWFP